MKLATRPHQFPGSVYSWHRMAAHGIVNAAAGPCWHAPVPPISRDHNRPTMTRHLHHSLILLLTATLLTGSLLPPAVCHAHADSDRPHSHPPAAHSGTSHSHSHLTAHVHLSLVEIVLSLVVPTGDNSDTSNPHDNNLIPHDVIAFGTDAMGCSSIEVRRPETMPLANSATPTHSRSSARGHGIHAPHQCLLSDTARCQRCGVLLI
jgi:hypothetical protein